MKIARWDSKLAGWMSAAHCESWAQLGRRATLSRHRIQQLRAGQLNSWPLQHLKSLCQTFNISLMELLEALGEAEVKAADTALHLQPNKTSSKAIASVRQSTLQCLEPLLRQLPTAAFAVQHHNLSAQQLLKILHPLDVLLNEWEVERLGEVGRVIPYDPTWQQPLTPENIESGTSVSIRYVGYRINKAIWIKAQVRVA